MALVKLLSVALTLAVTANAGFVRQDDENNWPGYRQIRMPVSYFPTLPAPPPLPPIPGFGPMYFPPQLNFPPPPKIPTPGEIANIKPEPGQVYSGIAVKSASGLVKDKNGKVRKSGTVVVTNDNGDVKEFKAGKSPPDINDPIAIPQNLW